MNVDSLPSSPLDSRYRNIIEYCQSPDIHPDDRAALFRKSAEEDFWFFCRYATSARYFVCRNDGCRYFGRHIFDHPFIFDRCRETQAEPNGYIDLWPRSHHKTTVITTFLTLWDFLHEPQSTFAIITWKIKDVGDAFVDVIRQEMEPHPIAGFSVEGRDGPPLKNEVLSYHWPEIFWADPESEAEVWRRGDLRLKSHPGVKEHSITMMGLNSMKTSWHFTHMVYDDIVNEISAANPDACADCTKKYRATVPMRHSAITTKRRMVGTRWARGDTYEAVIDDGGFILREAPMDCYDENMESVLHPGSDWLEDWRRDLDDSLFDANMRNRCIDLRSSFQFDQQWLHKRNYECSPEEIAHGANLYFFVDPAKLKAGGGPRKDYYSIVGLALRFDQRRYVIEIVRDRLTTTVATDLLFNIDKYWRGLGNPIKAWFYETRGASLDLDYWGAQKELKNYRSLEVREFDDNTKKDNRIIRLLGPWERGEIILPHRLDRWMDGARVDMVQVFLQKEFKPWKPRDGASRNRVNFGARNEDVLDALAQSESPKIKPQLEYPTEPIATSWRSSRRPDLERRLIERNFPGNQGPASRSGNPWAC